MNTPAGAKKTKRRGRWRACAVVAGFMAAAGVLLVVFGAVLFSSLIRMVDRVSAETISAEVEMRYDRLKSDGKIPAEQQALFESLYAQSQRDNASLWAVLLCRAVLDDSLMDGTITPREDQRAKDAVRLLQEQIALPRPELDKFLREYPELERPIRQFIERPFEAVDGSTVQNRPAAPPPPITGF